MARIAGHFFIRSFIMKPVLPAHRTEKITYAIRDIVLVAQEAQRMGKECLYLNIGDPNKFDFVTPKQIILDTCDALHHNKNGYAPSSGIEPARMAIKAEAEGNGFSTIHDLFISTGASEAIEIALTALINKGENFLVPSPTYPLYQAVLNKLGGDIRYYALDEEQGWEPNIDDIVANIDEKSRGILLINPNNPTGTCYSKEILLKVAAVAKRYNLIIFADEIYCKLLLDVDVIHHHIAALVPDQPVITFNGLSKSHLVPGFRIGWGIITGPAELVKSYNDGMQKIIRARLCANHPEQYSIPRALTGTQPHLTDMIQRLIRRRDITVQRFNEIPHCSLVTPQGAFYGFVRLHLDVDDMWFCKQLIQETGVVTVPGSGFGQADGTKHFRVVFLPPEEQLIRAYDLIEQFIKKHF